MRRFGRKTNMNILILSWRGPDHPLAGGAEQATWHHALGWQEAGHTVTLFTSSFAGAKEQESKAGIQIIRKGDQFVGVKAAAMLFYLFGKHQPFDIVVDEHHGIPFFTPLYVSKPKLVFIHEIAGPVWKLNSWPTPFNYLARWLGPVFEPLILKLYKQVHFMTVSASTQKQLLQLGIKNVHVVLNGVTLPKSRPSVAKSKTPMLIFLSALAKDKGVEDAINVFKIVHDHLPTAKFFIVGFGTPDYLEILKKRAGNLPVTFTGYVSEEKKFDLLATSHVLVFPSSHEGWGLVVIEANSVGTPAVVYPVPGLVDSTLHQKTGLVSELTTPESMASSVLGLIKSPEYSKYCLAAKKWAAEFSWSKSVHQSLELLNKVAK